MLDTSAPPPVLAAPDLEPPPPPRVSYNFTDNLPFPLSQSRIKAINNPEFCPFRFLTVEVEKRYRAPSSVSQLRGQLFEWLAMGSLNREYEIPKLPRTSRGAVTAEEKRIIFQASELKRLLPLYGMHVMKTCVPLTVEWQRGLLMSMLYDAVVWWDRSRDPNPENSSRSGPYILDAKLTANIYSTFGDYCWGEPWRMNHLQPHVYMRAASEVLGYPVGFVYAVFDYSTKMNHKLIEVKQTATDSGETNEAIRKALERLEEVNDSGWPALPFASQCKICPVPDCPKRTEVPKVFVLN